MFSHSVGCLFILLMVSFAVKKTLFNFIYSYLFIFTFASLVQEDISVKDIATRNLQDFTVYIFFYDSYGFESNI